MLSFRKRWNRPIKTLIVAICHLDGFSDFIFLVEEAQTSTESGQESPELSGSKSETEEKSTSKESDSTSTREEKESGEKDETTTSSAESKTFDYFFTLAYFCLLTACFLAEKSAIQL